MDQREKDFLRKNIARLRNDQANKRYMLVQLDPKKDARRAQSLTNEIANLEGEIASEEQKLGRA